MRIRREDVDHVRERSRIDEVVAEHVALRSAGVGSMKGLCPFHDEKSPSFHVRPQLGLWHCFGCNRGGDVISFVQEIDTLSFAEAVERLAGRIGYTLRYEDDGGRGAARGEQIGRRRRLLDANRLAAAFYTEQLTAPGDALVARRFLAERGFDRDAADLFGVGFAPRQGEALVKHLRGRGVTEDELVASGLAGTGRRGLYDRFRGRLLWPIRDTAGDVVGFGARRLFDDDRIEAKYLNTPETALYKKSTVLYGVDLAKREIAQQRQVVVVEGYTDVMACHLAGVTTAVATCGTAFGTEHVRIVRRLIGDESGKASVSLTSDAFARSVIFVFDGDAAGQKAAQRAFEGDQDFTSLTYVAVAPGGMDPCELRQVKGDEAVRELVASRQPLFEFAIRSALERFDLDTAEGRIAALRAAAPAVARIRDDSLRPEYTRRLAGWLGMDDAGSEVSRAVTAAARSARSTPSSASSAAAGSGSARRPSEAAGGGRRPPGADGAGHHTSQADGASPRNGAGPGRPRNGDRPGPPRTGAGPDRRDRGDGDRRDHADNDRRDRADGDRRDTPANDPAARGPMRAPAAHDPRDPVARVEREALECMLQVPHLVPAQDADGLDDSAFEVPAFRAVHAAVRAAGGMAAARGVTPSAWAERVREEAADAVRPLVTELAVTPLPADGDEAMARYAASVVLRMVELQVTRRIGTLRSRLQRMSPDDAGYQQVFTDLLATETERRSLRERIAGG